MGNKLTDARDVRFVLYEQLGIEDLCKSERFQDHSRETFDMILDAAEKLAANEFMPVNSKGDEIGCTWEEGKVKIPEPFHGPFRKFCEGGWLSMCENEAVGGQSVPAVVDFLYYQLFRMPCPKQESGKRISFLCPASDALHGSLIILIHTDFTAFMEGAPP